jgi:UDP-glucose 4-epimerase
VKILITGGAGYIGSHTIIDLFENTSHELISIDNFSNSSPQSYQRIEHICSKDVPNENIDLTDINKLTAFFNSHHIDGIIHFAAHKAVGESVTNPLKYYHNNITSLVNLLNCCHQFNIKHFIFSSSCTVYGEPEKLPVDESFPINHAISPYGNTKIIGEEIIQDFAASNSNFNAIILRYFNPIGAHQSGKIGELPNGKPENLVPYITQTAIGILPSLKVFGNDYNTRDGSCIRDYIHVSDIAHAHTIAINRLIKQKNTESVEIYNLGLGNGVSVFEVIHAFEKATSLKLNYEIVAKRPGDVEAIFANASKANNILGWKPLRTLEDAMLSAWKWEQLLQKNNNQVISK